MREWLGEFDLEDSEAWFTEWSDVLAKLSLRVQALEKIVPEDVMRMVFNAIFSAIYLNYYSGADFMSQFRSNAAKVETLLGELEHRVGEVTGGGRT